MVVFVVLSTKMDLKTVWVHLLLSVTGKQAFIICSIRNLSGINPRGSHNKYHTELKSILTDVALYPLHHGIMKVFAVQSCRIVFYYLIAFLQVVEHSTVKMTSPTSEMLTLLGEAQQIEAMVTQVCV